MDKIAVGPKAAGKIHIDAPVSENLKAVASALDRAVEDLTVVILDRDRHSKIIKEVRDAGARIKLITDGDVSPAVSVGIEGSGVHMMLGVGGAPEGVIAAAALKCLGGDMQGKLWPENDNDDKRALEMGITDINKVLTIDDMVHGEDVFFVATAITQADMLEGVRYFGGGARTHSIVMRYKTGTVRFVDAIHKFDKKPFAIKLA
ncbi:Fructose-1,6-bisphosphatase class 2 [bioreactor metagenome]|uniref:Fructose-1,6-bisphosphatase class 2 n=1 Tax=bioreactor metagenome TaxID=1076179 RepID=A0A645G9T5_9ZZZZ